MFHKYESFEKIANTADGLSFSQFNGSGALARRDLKIENVMMQDLKRQIFFKMRTLKIKFYFPQNSTFCCTLLTMAVFSRAVFQVA